MSEKDRPTKLVGYVHFMEGLTDEELAQADKVIATIESDYRKGETKGGFFPISIATPEKKT